MSTFSAPEEGFFSAKSGRLSTAPGQISTLVVRVLIFTISSCSVHEKGTIGDYDKAVERKETKLRRASGAKLTGRMQGLTDSENR